MQTAESLATYARMDTSSVDPSIGCTDVTLLKAQLLLQPWIAELHAQKLGMWTPSEKSDYIFTCSEVLSQTLGFGFENQTPCILFPRYEIGFLSQLRWYGSSFYEDDFGTTVMLSTYIDNIVFGLRFFIDSKIEFLIRNVKPQFILLGVIQKEDDGEIITNINQTVQFRLSNAEGVSS